MSTEISIASAINTHAADAIAYQTRGMGNFERGTVEFRDEIIRLVREYRSLGYADSLVHRRLEEHLDRRWTLEQIEAYERTMQGSDGVISMATEAAERVGRANVTAVEEVFSPDIIDSGFVPLLLDESIPDEIMPSDSRYDGLVNVIIRTYRNTSDAGTIKEKLEDNRSRNFSVRLVERYEASYNQSHNLTVSLNFARGNDPIPDNWKKEIPKPRTPTEIKWKDAFLKSVFPKGTPKKLSTRLANTDDKKVILKAVFLYNNPKTPRKVRAPRPNPHFKKSIELHNSQDHKEVYYARLQRFFEGAKARRGNDIVNFVSREKGINLMSNIDPSVLIHPLFTIEKFSEDCKKPWENVVSRKGLRFVFTTRNEVYFTHLDQRMNFGRLSILINFREHTISCIKRDENFTAQPFPYINEQTVCMGSNAQSIMGALKEGRVSEALTELYTTMTHYNPNSTPYKGLGEFFQGARDGILKRNNGEQPEIEVIV